MHSIVFYMKGGGHMAADQQSLDIAAIYERHSKTVYRVCFAFMKNHADTEDAVQETFFRLIRKQPTFETPEHEKAWLIRTASNICKNELKHWRRKQTALDDQANIPAPEATDYGAGMRSWRCRSDIRLLFTSIIMKAIKQRKSRKCLKNRTPQSGIICVRRG